MTINNNLNMKLKYLFLLGVLLSLATLSTSTPLSPEPFSSPGFNISTILPRDMPPNRASCGDLSGWWTVAMCPRHAMKVEGPFIAHDSGAALKALLHKKCKTWFTKGITGWDFKYEDEEHMKASIRFGLCGADWCVTNAVWEATGPTGRVRMNGCQSWRYWHKGRFFGWHCRYEACFLSVRFIVREGS